MEKKNEQNDENKFTNKKCPSVRSDLKVLKTSEYDQEMPQSMTTDKPKRLRMLTAILQQEHV